MARKRFFRTSSAVLIIVALFWLAVNLTGYSLPEEVSLFRKVSVPEKVEEVLGDVKEQFPWGRGEKSEEDPTAEPRVLSLAEVGEEAREKVVTESKEVIREKVVEVLRGLIEKLTEEGEAQGEVCHQICQEVCQEVCK